MWNTTFLGVDLYHILAWFYIFSFLGWLWESCYVSVIEKKIVNRGFIIGPLCTIYGVGGVGIYLILRPISDNLIVLFLGGMITATVIEYFTAVIMEKLFKTSWWNYSDKKFNFQGRISLESSIAWGFLSILLFWILMPVANGIVNIFDVATGQVMIIIMTILYVVDFIFSILAAMELGKKLGKLEEVVSEFGEFLHNTRIYTSVEELLERLGPFKKTLNIKDKLDAVQGHLSKLVNKQEKPEQTGEASSRLNVIRKKYEKAVALGGFNFRRLFYSYPKLKSTDKVKTLRKSTRKEIRG